MLLKKIIPLIILFLSVSFYALTTQAKNTHLIAITQIAPHPSLDRIRQGFLDVFQTVYPNYQIDYQNAQGSQPLSVQIAQKFASQNPKVIVAIATPSAMASYQVAKEYNVPVLYVGVSNPQLAKFTDSKGMPLPGLFGISDMIPAHEQVAFIQSLQLHKKIQKIGVLYSTGEINANAQRDAFEEALHDTSFTMKSYPVQTSVDIPLAAEKAAQECDLIYIFNDNGIVSGISHIIQIGDRLGVPVVTSDPESVKLGALAALAYDQYTIGAQAAHLLIEYMRNPEIAKTNIKPSLGVTIYFNQHKGRHHQVICTPCEEKRHNIVMIEEDKK